ncbi:anaerobic nitric oxide reductase flavorubredoxin [Treponema zuelzerae]|uniref:Anaerobic nitric oxide reductase flavorubredoxin n=1 Tax=Teretinema zuelzerae TaxID=156 RepID=A0AAE3EHY1_9SPIR|nr:anaerobic nitric oxide reductase flavorubredoxin [Teretinema zuelzerae]MCD1653839.1 anaerobic nitric oxide reductase flavorubredoxin [Teretinema zuelzerae]
MHIPVKNNVSWVGKIDWELQKFHGDEYSTTKGSTYNSYLIREEKNVLIDSVWKPYAKEFVENLKAEIPLEKIDFIIANHGEVDHSGALSELIRHIPNVPVYCTENAVKSLTGQYHEKWNFHTVKTGDSIDIGNGKKLVFVEMKMLHWPDSMATYMTGDNILFSNDAFGQHYASNSLFNDLVDKGELFEECLKYYANILTPFSALVDKKIQEVLSLKLPIDIIAPSHGVIWRDNPIQIVQKYIEWCKDYQEDQITILYDTMWEGTRHMAEAIASGIRDSGCTSTVKVFNISKSDKNDLITEVFKAKHILVGSPTIGKGITHATAGLLEMIEGLRFRNKKAASFGCYGWSGEAVAKLNKLLTASGFELVNDGLKALWEPDGTTIDQCKAFGKSVINP